MNITEYLLEHGRNEQTAIISGGISYSYSDLRRALGSFSVSLKSLDVQPGDRIGILASNSFFWITAYLAIMGLGGVAVPFAPVILPDTFRKHERFVHCKAICIERRYFNKYISVLPEKTPLIFDHQSSLLESNRAPITVPIDEDQDAAFMFTSGTTALPRVVRVTHKNIRANTESIITSLGLTSSERILAVLPFYYCFGTSLLHTHLRVGGTLVLANNFVYPEIILDLMEQTDCTAIAGVPSTFQTLLRNTTFPKRTLPHLFKVQQAGGKLHEVLLKELIDTLPQAEIFVMYGQTEATARLSCLPPEKLETKLGSIGKGIPGVELSVVNEFNQPVETGQVGEIIARGDNISPGYLNDPQGTYEKFPGGVLHTGDIASVDMDGYITIVDRMSDFIKSQGYRISSQEIEANVLTLTDIVSAAAVGEPDLAHGEAIHLFVTLRSSSQLNTNDILAHCRRVLPRYMVPHKVDIIKRMPLNANGKIMKSQLKGYKVLE
ncbi:MAG: AMP-binding protein [Anaerolineaceae bacterium]